MIAFMMMGLFFFTLSFTIGLLANAMMSEYNSALKERWMDMSTGLGMVGMCMFFLSVACM